MFLDCPAYLDHERTVRCGLPAEVRCRFTMRSTASPPGLTGNHDGRHGTGGPLHQDPGGPGQAIRRPNTAPAYYLGRPASCWITALSPRRTDPASLT
jgi:hypothetical protein